MLAALAQALPAQETRWESLSRGFRSQPVDQRQLLWFLAAMGLLIGLLALLAHVVNNQSSRGYCGPRRLFWSLCRAHKLSISDRWAMWLVARTRGLRDPARLFLEPELLDPAQLPPRFRVQAARFDALRKRLFVWDDQPERRPGAGGAAQSDAQADQPAGPGPLAPQIPPPQLHLPDSWGSRWPEIPTD